MSDPFQEFDEDANAEEVFADSSNNNQESGDAFTTQEPVPTYNDESAQDPFASASAPQDNSYMPEVSIESKIPAGDTPLSKWQDSRKKVLAQRKTAADEAKLKAIEDAKADIAKFYQQRSENIQKTMAANRLEEQNTKKDLESLMRGGSDWEKVGRFANLQPKANEDRRVARMRKLLVQLKSKSDHE